jgi:transcriptional regulator with XRE-family HTH domain
MGSSFGTRFRQRTVNMAKSPSTKLVDELKLALKAAGKTYADLAGHLGLSEPAIKRTFSNQTFTLERFTQACQFAGIDMLELVQRASDRGPLISTLTVDQEEELFSDLKLLFLANLTLNRWPFKDILKSFEFTEHELIRGLARLDRMKMIELQPGNDYKLLVSRYFSWRKEGPVQRFFQRHVQSEFFNSKFAETGDKLAFASGMLSRANIARFHEQLDKLVKEFDELNREDADLPVSERFTVSIVLAMRPWQFPPFATFRKIPKRHSL